MHHCRHETAVPLRIPEFVVRQFEHSVSQLPVTPPLCQEDKATAEVYVGDRATFSRVRPGDACQNCVFGIESPSGLAV